jgi:amidase
MLLRDRPASPYKFKETGMSDDLWRFDAARLAQAIRGRAVSSREAVAACLSRLEAVNPHVNAVVETLADEALRLADKADRDMANGRPIGPLHGVPVTTKINTDQKGCATSGGVAAFANLIAGEDSPSIANLRKAGAIVIGRTNAPEFSWRWFTDNELYGETINPWNRERTCGGSSGGAAVAVATGMCPLAQGTDFGGSIRHPALCCGVAGLRPTLGRVPAYNATTGDRPITAQFMAVHGPIARRVGDLRLALGAMTAGDARDPWWVPAPFAGPSPATPIRVALLDRNLRPGLDPDIAAALDQAALWLQDAGYAVEPAEAPSIEEASHLWSTLVLNEAKLAMISQIDRYGGAATRKAGELMIRQAPPADFAAFVKALGRRATLLREWQMFLEKYPLILMPVCREPAFELGLDQRDDAAMKRILDAVAPILAPAVLGLPCIAVPTGVRAHVPLAVQLVAGRFREDLCLDAAEVIERRAGDLTPIDPV